MARGALTRGEDRLLIVAAVMKDAGCFEVGARRRELSETELLERLARLSKEERRRMIVRGRGILGWSR